MRVFLDTNVLVAAFATRGLCADAMRTVLTAHELIVGETFLAELVRILESKLRMPAARAKSVSSFVREHAKVADPAAWPETDPQDRWVVAAAVQGQADVLVTGDSDLLDVAAEAPFPVVTPRGFWKQLR